MIKLTNFYISQAFIILIITNIIITHINNIMNKLINFQTLQLLANFEKNLDRYPIRKKNKKEATEAPKPKYIF